MKEILPIGRDFIYEDMEEMETHIDQMECAGYYLRQRLYASRFVDDKYKLVWSCEFRKKSLT